MKYSILTFGCRLNAAESVAIESRARSAGLSDAIVVNTCGFLEASKEESLKEIPFIFYSSVFTDRDEAEAADISDRAASFTRSSPFEFDDRVSRHQWALYLQDRVRMSDRFTMEFGVRFDRTRLLVPASQWSPRVGAAYTSTDRATTAVEHPVASLARIRRRPVPVPACRIDS